MAAQSLLATKPLRLNATVSDGRLVVSFSHPPSASSYKEYLENLRDSYDDEHTWDITISGKQVSMKLPSDIAFEFPTGSKDAVLVFRDEEKASKWKEKMLLWEMGKDQAQTKRTISRSLTVGRLNEMLGSWLS